MSEQIYFQKYEQNVRVGDVLAYLNSKKESDFLFEQTDKLKDARYVFLIIGEEIPDDILVVEKCKELLKERRNLNVLVKKEVFELYEKCKKNSDNEIALNKMLFQIIRIINESEDERKWIYTYMSPENLISIVGKIVLSEYFKVEFAKAIIEVEPKEYFQNMLIFRNEGSVDLQGYYLDGFFTHKVGKHRPKLEKFNSVIDEVRPGEKSRIPFEFHAPDIAGTFIFYIIVKKVGHALKMEDAIKSFVIHVKSIGSPQGCDAILVNESPENGKLYTDKQEVVKEWHLKNISGEDWRKVIFKVKYEHITHYFCIERKKILGIVRNGEEFVIKIKFYPPDIPGKYTTFWGLYKENGDEIKTDGPLCCSVITQYEEFLEDPSRQNAFHILKG